VNKENIFVRHSEFPGLDQVIRTGFKDTLAGTPCPPLIMIGGQRYTIHSSGKLIPNSYIGEMRAASRAGIPKKGNDVKFCDLEWKDGNHINGNVRDDTDRIIGTFTVELFAGMGTIPRESIKETRKEHVMRNLYVVFVVDPNEDVVNETVAISKSPDGAKFKALTELKDDLAKDIDEYDILVVPQGHVRDKKEVQEVKIVS
jgi:hypothetical protein